MDPMTNNSSDSAMDSGKPGTRPSEQTTPSLSGATLLGLPAELRLQIWRTYCTWPRKPYLRYAADFSGGAEMTLVEAGLLFTCKQIYAELWPILTANVQLHITYLSHSPEEPLQFPSPHVCEWIRSMVFHCSAGLSLWDEDVPPETPIRFHGFPNLKTFTVCKPMWVRVDELLAEDGVTRMTRETYEASSEEKKLAAWVALTWMSADAIIGIVVRWARSSWLSKVLDPEYHLQIHDLESDGENEDAGKDSEGQNEAMELEVINNVHTILEAELCLFEGSGYAPALIQTLLVTIDMRHKKIIESRLLSDEEMGKRGEEASEAT
ncbi:hypothetical protein DL769_006352 [Monosporascus sp. CRB-8-3]|nr:hypothetical protein DL769_006352 [Monosporascus sp. CRB-8-3]